MGLKATILKNTSYLTIGNQIGNLLQFFFFLYFARQFGEKVVGQYSFAFSFTYIFSVIADLGLSSFLIREIARDLSGNRQLFARSLILRLLSLAFVSFWVFIIIIVFPAYFPNIIIKIILLMGLYHFFFSLADVILAEFKAHDRMGLVALLNIFVRFIISIAGISLIMLRFDFLTVLICFPIGSLIYLIVCSYFSARYFKMIGLQFKELNLTNLFIKLLPFAFTIIFVETLHHQDILMLKFFINDQIVGIYSVANKVVIIFLGVLLFIHTALLPTMSQLYLESKAKLINTAKQSLRYMVIIGLPLSAGLYAVSDKTIVFLFSDKFKDSVSALNILCWTIILGFAAITYSVLLTSINRQTVKGISLGICLVFNFILNLIMIPKLSYNGAAMAKLMTEALQLILFAYFSSKYLTSLSIHKIVIKPAASCFLMYITIRFFYQWNLIYLILISILVYFTSLAVLRGYTEDEIEFIKNLFSKKAIQMK
jgi:O-antigen/teichoic acid export membrane protein